MVTLPRFQAVLVNRDLAEVSSRLRGLAPVPEVFDRVEPVAQDVRQAPG